MNQRRLFCRSPHLGSVAERHLPSSDLAFIDRCLTAALNSGGEGEIDFSREEGVSYNPLPARIALILLNDGKIRNSDVIAAGMLASVHLTPDKIRDNALLASEELSRISALLDALVHFPKTLQSEAELRPELSSVVCALWLDRARHIHLSKNDDNINHSRNFLKEITPILNETSEALGTLHHLLSTWISRFGERLSHHTSTSAGS